MNFYDGKRGNWKQWLGVLIAFYIFFLFIIPNTGNSYSLIAAKRMAASSNLRSIAYAYTAYMTKGQNPQMLAAKSGDTVHTVAILFASENALNEASLWVMKNDPKLLNQTIPKQVIAGTHPSEQLDPDFAKLTLAYEIAANIPLDAPVTTTPVVWTRGLREDGTWAPDSPWGGKGGHIAYLDGHVEWVDVKLSTKPGETALVKFGTGLPTVNIREALPPGAIILRAEPNPAGK